MPVAEGLYHELHGPADGAKLILSSGLGGSASYWQPNLDALAAEHRVLSYDHRGTGRSDRALPDAVTVDDFADDMLVLMDAIGWVSASIVGHAAGGVAGLALALKAPERIDRLVVVNGWVRPDPHFLRCFEARLALLRNSGPEAYLRAQPIFLYPANWISEHSADLDAELAHQLASFPGVETMEKRIAALARFDISDRLGDIHTPVMFYASDDDMLVPSTASREASRDLGIFLATSWGGHACNVTVPDAFNSSILTFLGD